MNLLDKFAEVQIKADKRITEGDKFYCEQQQRAYELAITHYKELAFFWADMESAQMNVFGTKEGRVFHDYLLSSKGPSISEKSIKRHIEDLHRDFISTLIRYFNSTYHVTIRTEDVVSSLVPQAPKVRYESDLELAEAYHAQMQDLTVQYSDVVDQIILRLDGHSFAERAFLELYEKCHQAAWSSYNQKPEFERRNSVIQFSGYFCKYKDTYDKWELVDKMKEILKGAAYYETGSYQIFPCGFEELFGYSITGNVIEFPACKKLCRLKMFKNNRVDLQFASPELAKEFASNYLGLVC